VANAAMHCAEVRYSPITFRIAEHLDALEAGAVFRAHPNDMRWELLVVLDDVRSHRGAYAEDTGR